MKVLVLNSGSSSLRYVLFDMQKEQALLSGHIDGIGLSTCKSVIKRGGVGVEKKQFFKDYVDSIIFALKSLKEYGAVKDFPEISAVGHRVVHGGEFYSDSVLVNDIVVKRIRDLSDLAPLHNPHNLAGIIACRQLLPKTPQVAVFDTAFHHSMPQKNYLYALPFDLYKKHKVRRYGFHGISHKYVSGQALKLLGSRDSKVIVCHLGNGCSVTAVKNGKSFMTSMGFTPLEGLMMGTRSGSFDPAILIYLMAHERFHIKDLNDLVNKKSGLLGISGISSDMRTLRKNEIKGSESAKLAIDMFADRVAFYIGGYASLMNGVDAIVFTAGIGEGGWYVRKRILESLEHLGVKYDVKSNRKNHVVISSHSSKVKVYVIPTSEELQIAREAKGVLKK